MTTRRRFPLARRDRIARPRTVRPAQTLVLERAYMDHFDISPAWRLYGKNVREDIQPAHVIEQTLLPMIQTDYPGATMRFTRSPDGDRFIITIPPSPAHLSPKLKAFFGIK